MGKRKHRVYLFLAIVFVALGAAALVASCGGGGGGGETSAALTNATAPAAASAAAQTLLLVGPATSLGDITPTGLQGSSHTPPLTAIAERMLDLSREKAMGSGALRAQGSMPPQTTSCSGGGSMTMSATWTDDPSDPNGMRDIIMNISFQSCVDAGVTMNGSATFKAMGTLSSPTSLVFSTTSLSYADPYENDSLTMSGFNMTISSLVYDGMGNLTGGTITMNGTVSGTLDGSPVNESCDHLAITFGSDPSGETYSVAGRLRPSCLGGWINISTETEVRVATGDQCPTQGTIVVTSGGNTVRAVVSADTSITVTLNGAEVAHYNDCSGIEGVCS